MSFGPNDRLKALAIVNIFETAKPFGNYAACVVLDDGAGISYGVSQFTHRSGSLYAVAVRYLENGGAIGRTVIKNNLEILSRSSERSIDIASANETLKQALRAAAITSEMRRAQGEIAFEMYLSPAIRACEGSGFVLPLSLAVVYDSINHGSWEKLRDRVSTAGEPGNGSGPDETSFERMWITAYVAARHAWLGRIARLRPTRYRTRFFIEQIARGNWHLELPVNVHGERLTEAELNKNIMDGHIAAADGESQSVPKDSAVGPLPATAKGAAENTAVSLPENLSNSSEPSRPQQQPAPTDKTGQPPNDNQKTHESTADARQVLETVEANVISAAEKFDRVESVVTKVTRRTDSAKSLWTTVAGTAWQTGWAICSFAVGMPKEIWLVAAIIAGVLMLLYLYRQIALGKIRETAKRDA